MLSVPTTLLHSALSANLSLDCTVASLDVLVNSKSEKAIKKQRRVYQCFCHQYHETVCLQAVVGGWEQGRGAGGGWGGGGCPRQGHPGQMG